MGVNIDVEEVAESDRRSKMRRLRAEGVNPFPHGAVHGRTPIGEIYGGAPTSFAGEHLEHRYRVAGRLMARRSHGKGSFFDLEDQSGSIQLYLRNDKLKAESYRLSLEFDIGDIIEAEGCIYVTRRNQVALSVKALTLLAKSLLPPPARYHGVKNRGNRHRYRELDLMESTVRRLFGVRAGVIQAVRDWMNEHGYVEIETPVLHSDASGASARPFCTYHNALGRELALRISTELHLKRCVVGGLEKVYELGKCFRNEGISRRHSPEFTMMEWVCGYSDYAQVAAFTEEMIAAVAQRVLGSTDIKCCGETIDLAKPWRQTTVKDVVLQVVGVDIARTTSRELTALIQRDGSGDDWPHAVRSVYSKLVEPTLIQPTMVFDFPVDASLSAKRHQREPKLAEQFDAVIGGVELATGNSELNDPDEQRDKFREQSKGTRAGLSASEGSYVRALEYGLLPCAGAGIGVDRLLMLLTGRESLREVVLFPIVRDNEIT